MQGNELSVITRSKDLCEYVLTVTYKSPKRFRFTLTSRLQNYTLEIVEKLIEANYVRVRGEREYLERVKLQREALGKCKLLSYMSEIAMKQKCILPKQYEQISKKISDSQNMIMAWINSDKRRYGANK